MGIAIDFTTTTESTTRPTSLLIPELVYEIERYLEIQDLAAAALVCRAWHEAWSSSLYSTVRCHIRRTSAPLGVVSSSLDPTKKTAFHSFTAAPPARNNYQGYVQHKYYSVQQHLHLQQHHQQYIPPFLNFQKYGRWIRSLEVSNLYCLPSVPLLHSTGAAISSHSSLSPASSSSAFGLASLPPPAQDHLSQIQACWHLIQLDISRTVMSLERLDDLLSSLPRLKVFKFEVVNKTEIATANGLHGVSGGSNGGGGGSFGSSFRRGYMQQQPASLLLKKPKQVTLEGLEPDVIRVIARRLGGQLERLDLVFTVTGRIGLSTFLELLSNCRSTLKSLALTRAEIYQTDYSRERHAAMEISALFASLLGTTSATTTSSLSSSSSSSLITSSPSSPSSSSSLPTFPPALERLSFNSCAIPDREFEWFLRHAPRLRELNLHDCRFLNKPAVASILQHSPLLETLSLRSVPYVDADALKLLFETIPRSSEVATATASASHHTAGSHASGATATSGVNGSGGASTSTASRETTGLRLKSIRLAYLRQLNDTVMETIARYQGASLERLSVQWCPHVTDVGILPIFMYCQRLQDLSLYLSKPTLNIFKDLTDEPVNGVTTADIMTATEATTMTPATTTVTAAPAAGSPAPGKRRLWACANTLERLEVGGQMFVDRIRSSSEHLQPQLYHHLSPNPHHMRSPSGNQDLTLGGIGGAGGPNAVNNGGSAGIATINTGSTTTNSSHSNVIHDPYSIAHYQGYPMYHLWRYHRLSDPFRELQAQLETLPRLKHLGVQAKGIEHLLRRGFGPNVHIQSLALLNQQGRVWSPEEIREMFEHMPHLRTLVCEKSTIMAGGSQSGGMGSGVGSGSCGAQLKGVDLLKRQMHMRRVLEDHRVELVQSTLSQ
ncbi:hypothetical protein BG015_010324 [Linnemannia schmuckeri]|uniref:F-box domain-containing protein n=1 Tax=Linnemannia schmuckeri TaxID=64567 RepID=A0A9P5V8X8_9FUNG|nr:hypothetical protein BG015_010324 [Linnemannia schmuckeri]